MNSTHVPKGEHDEGDNVPAPAQRHLLGSRSPPPTLSLSLRLLSPAYPDGRANIDDFCPPRLPLRDGKTTPGLD